MAQYYDQTTRKNREFWFSMLLVTNKGLIFDAMQKATYYPRKIGVSGQEEEESSITCASFFQDELYDSNNNNWNRPLRGKRRGR